MERYEIVWYMIHNMCLIKFLISVGRDFRKKEQVTLTKLVNGWENNITIFLGNCEGARSENNGMWISVKAETKLHYSKEQRNFGTFRLYLQPSLFNPEDGGEDWIFEDRLL
jgi:hypothetical protein